MLLALGRPPRVVGRVPRRRTHVDVAGILADPAARIVALNPDRRATEHWKAYLENAAPLSASGRIASASHYSLAIAVLRAVDHQFDWTRVRRLRQWNGPASGVVPQEDRPDPVLLGALDRYVAALTRCGLERHVLQLEQLPDHAELGMAAASWTALTSSAQPAPPSPALWNVTATQLLRELAWDNLTTPMQVLRRALEVLRTADGGQPPSWMQPLSTSSAPMFQWGQLRRWLMLPPPPPSPPLESSFQTAARRDKSPAQSTSADGAMAGVPAVAPHAHVHFLIHKPQELSPLHLALLDALVVWLKKEGVLCSAHLLWYDEALRLGRMDCADDDVLCSALGRPPPRTWMDDPPDMPIMPPPATAAPVQPAFALARERLLVPDLTAVARLPARPRLPWAVWRFASSAHQVAAIAKSAAIAVAAGKSVLVVTPGSMAAQEDVAAALLAAGVADVRFPMRTLAGEPIVQLFIRMLTLLELAVLPNASRYAVTAAVRSVLSAVASTGARSAAAADLAAADASAELDPGMVDSLVTELMVSEFTPEALPCTELLARMIRGSPFASKLLDPSDLKQRHDSELLGRALRCAVNECADPVAKRSRQTEVALIRAALESQETAVPDSGRLGKGETNGPSRARAYIMPISTASTHGVSAEVIYLLDARTNIHDRLMTLWNQLSLEPGHATVDTIAQQAYIGSLLMLLMHGTQTQGTQLSLVVSYYGSVSQPLAALFGSRVSHAAWPKAPLASYPWLAMPETAIVSAPRDSAALSADGWGALARAQRSDHQSVAELPVPSLLLRSTVDRLLICARQYRYGNDRTPLSDTAAPERMAQQAALATLEQIQTHRIDLGEERAVGVRKLFDENAQRLFGELSANEALACEERKTALEHFLKRHPQLWAANSRVGETVPTSLTLPNNQIVQLEVFWHGVWMQQDEGVEKGPQVVLFSDRFSRPLDELRLALAVSAHNARYPAAPATTASLRVIGRAMNAFFVPQFRLSSWLAESLAEAGAMLQASLTLSAQPQLPPRQPNAKGACTVCDWRTLCGGRTKHQVE